MATSQLASRSTSTSRLALLWQCGSISKGVQRPHSLKSDEQPFASRAVLSSRRVSETGIKCEREKESEKSSCSQKETVQRIHKDFETLFTSQKASGATVSSTGLRAPYIESHPVSIPESSYHVGAHQVHHCSLLLAGHRLQHPR